MLLYNKAYPFEKKKGIIPFPLVFGSCFEGGREGGLRELDGRSEWALSLPFSIPSLAQEIGEGFQKGSHHMPVAVEVSGMHGPVGGQIGSDCLLLNWNVYLFGECLPRHVLS